MRHASTEKLAIALILLGTFVGSFVLTTALFDTYEHSHGYYDQGIADSIEVGQP